MTALIMRIVDALSEAIDRAKPEDLTDELRQHIRRAILKLDLGLIEASEQAELDAAVPGGQAVTGGTGHNKGS